MMSYQNTSKHTKGTASVTRFLLRQCLIVSNKAHIGRIYGRGS